MTADIELTKKGEAFVAAALAEPDDVLVVTLGRTDRTSIASIIDSLIAALDEIDDDPDLECGGDPEPDDDGEPNLGAPERHPHGYGMGLHRHTPQWHGAGRDDEREEENEHGGDILDEPHDEKDEGNDEPWLGSSEPRARDLSVRTWWGSPYPAYDPFDQTRWTQGQSGQDYELDESDAEDDDPAEEGDPREWDGDEHEPSLGWCGNALLGTLGDDRDFEGEHDGREQEEYW